MRPNAASTSSGPSRRSILASAAVASAAAAGGMPLVTACGGEEVPQMGLEIATTVTVREGTAPPKEE
ncbi:hypothetical protein ACWDBW_43515 [Streptomyces sp. NPDC001107]